MEPGGQVMHLENVREESAAERKPAVLSGDMLDTSGDDKKPPNVATFKFGGSSLLGANRMLHAAGLVRGEASESNVCVVVSAMKGVTDHLLSVDRALASGKQGQARREAEIVMDLHLE